MARPLALCVLFASVALAADPDPAERYARAVKQEDEIARKTAERLVKPGESEREWVRDSSRYFAEFHERMCYRLDLKKDAAFSRDTFAAYAARFLGPDSPPWRVVEIADDARGIFKQLDVNKDGGLTREECSPGLAEKFDTADADKDGKISPTEYRDYLTARIGHETQFVPPDDKGKGDRAKDESKAKPPAPPADPDEPRPVVLRTLKDLPKDVPGWFRELDTDKDLQVGLYEWVAAKRPPAEFQAMDLNGDGLLEVGEYLRWRKMQADGGGKPTADLHAAMPDKDKGKDKKK
jgi:EF hand